MRESLRHGGERLEPRLEASEAEDGGRQRRGGSQAQATAQQAGAAAGGDQHGKPARIAMQDTTVPPKETGNKRCT